MSDGGWARCGLLMTVLLWMCGCSYPSTPAEQTGMGTVRQIQPDSFWHGSSITHETDSGYVKVLSPVCWQGLDYVWVNQHADIRFHWDSERVCYRIDGVQR